MNVTAPSSAHESPAGHPWSVAQVALAVAAALPAASILWVIVRYGVNSPFWDQWGAVSGLLVPSADVGFNELVAQHNESRKFFPRLAFIGLARLTGWDVRFEMGLSLLTGAATSVGLFRLIRRTTRWDRTRSLTVLVLANLLLFGLVQHRNWLWGIQLIVFVPAACLVASLLAATSRSGAASRVVVCVLACTVATYSFANGMATWVLVMPALALCGGPLPRRHLVAFGFAALSVIGFYFVGYQTPDGVPSPVAGLARPGQVLMFLLPWLGSALGQGVWYAPLAGALALGAILLGALLFCIAAVWRRRSDRTLVAGAVPWLCLAGYPVASGLVAALGRAGVTEPLVSRYTTVSAQLPIALLVLLPLVLRRARLPRWLLPAAAAGLVLLHILTTVPAYWRMRTDRVRRLQGKACLAWIAIAPEDDCLRYTVSPYPELARARAAGLDERGMIAPPLARDAAAAAYAPVDGGGAAGRLETTRVESGDIVMSGWALLPGRAEPADAVLLCLDGRVFALAWERTARGSEEPVRPGQLASATGWTRRLPAPPTGGTLSAWAYDATLGVAYPLDGTFPYSPPR